MRKNSFLFGDKSILYKRIMKKQEVHIGLNELKSMIRETLKPLMESHYPMSGSCTYRPGENADITEEEYDELVNCMPEEFTVGFHNESSGGDGYYTPDETYVVPNEDDVEEIRAAITNIQNPDLKDKIEMEFNEWLDSADPDMDYDEPDPDSYLDEMDQSQDVVDASDPHFDDPEQITADKEADWNEYTAEPAWFDSKSNWCKEHPHVLNDINGNVEGDAQYAGEDDYKRTGQGHQRAMAAMSDDPFKKWWGQNGRENTTEFLKASKGWFPADFNDEQYSDSTYRVNDMGQVNESVKKYIRRLVKEAMEGDSSKQYVIQTRTGGYLMDIKDDSVHYDDETLILSAIVGRTPVSIMVYEQDYQNLVSNGKPCEGQYKTLNRGGDASPEMECTITVYNA